jgi:phosphohistidine swiveling domain-containing protein
MQARPPTFDARGDTPGPSDDDGRSRGQTTLDFAVGMSLFLISVAFVISFTPNLIQPFADSGTEDTIIANRVASQLVEGTLADPGKPYVLDKACTMAFFWPGNLDSSNYESLQSYDDVTTKSFWDGSCNFEPTYLHERLGVAGIGDDGNIDRALSPGLQVEIRADNNSDGVTKLLCLDANNRSTSDAEVIDPLVDANGPVGGPCDVSGADQDIPFVAGGDPPEDSGSVVVARRIVTIDGIRATVYVRVW